MIADLHTHSVASDGTLTPVDLLAAAASAGVAMLSITDHDTIAAYAQLPTRLPPGIELVAGIELSAQWRRQGIHVVGLNIALGSSALHAAVRCQRATRRERAARIAAKLDRLGIAGALKGATEIAGNDNVGRPHFAEFLVSSGVVSTVGQAFARYLRAGKPASVPETWPTIAAAVGWIRDAGGTAVLAHPAKYQLTRRKLDELASEFGAAGGEALEVISGQQLPAVTRNLAELAAAHGLAASVGSDFHRPGQTWAALGGARLPAACTPVWEQW